MVKAKPLILFFALFLLCVGMAQATVTEVDLKDPNDVWVRADNFEEGGSNPFPISVEVVNDLDLFNCTVISTGGKLNYTKNSSEIEGDTYYMATVVNQTGDNDVTVKCSDADNQTINYEVTDTEVLTIYYLFEYSEGDLSKAVIDMLVTGIIFGGSIIAIPVLFGMYLYWRKYNKWP